MTTTSRGAYWLAKSSAERLIQKMILEVLTSKGLSGWTVIFSRESSRLGFCDLSTREIAISRKVVASDWAQAVDTAMHEAAHAIAGPGAAHGPRWRAIARELGATPESSASFINSQNHGETKQVKTSYGPVAVVLGETTILHRDAGLLKVVDLQRKYFVGENDQGVLYKIAVDKLHRSYGDPTKIVQRAVTLKDRQGKPVEITLGKSSMIYEGRTFIAAAPRSRNVLCLDAQGRELLVPADFFKEK